MSQLVQFNVDGKIFQSQFDLVNSDQFEVQSVPRAYKVSWDASVNPMDKVNELLNANPKNLLFIDENVLNAYGASLQVAKERMFVAKASENFKTLDGVTSLLDFLQQHKFTKGETLVVVGGGIIQDVGAFVGACYKRGIRWVHFPTTLLSMCDSCIGGKTGVNYNGAKNQIALFSSPNAVFINPAFLTTLPVDAIRSGLGEILKLFIMAGEPYLSLYRECVKDGLVVNVANYKKLIFGALGIKRAVVEEDEFELHHRKSLNYGHTIGHAIEALSNYAIPHGQAVVLGMMIVNDLSLQKEFLKLDEKILLNKLCSELLNTEILALMQSMDIEAILEVLQKDKKVEGGEISFILLNTPGELRFTKMKLEASLTDQIRSSVRSTFSS